MQSTTEKILLNEREKLIKKITEYKKQAAVEGRTNFTEYKNLDGSITSGNIDFGLASLEQKLYKIDIQLDELSNPTEEDAEKDPNFILTYPHDLGSVSYKQNYMLFKFWENQIDVRTNDRMKKQIYPIIKIPISSRIMYSSLSMEYSRTGLNQLANVLYENAREFGVTTGGIEAALNNSISQETVEQMLEGFLLSTTLRTDLEAIKAGYYATGLAYNPNSTARFHGDEAKSRTFYPTWTFVPKTAQDARTLADIIRAFKRNALPSILNPTVNKLNRYSNHYKYPRRVTIELYIKNKLYRKHQYLPMVITRLEVSHNDKAGSGVTDSIPLSKDREKVYLSETTVNLNLLETTVFTSQSVDHVTHLN